jgi:hypothetical protein
MEWKWEKRVNDNVGCPHRCQSAYTARQELEMEPEWREER